MYRFLVESEIERGTPESPGRRSAYFYGSQQLLQLRGQAKQKLGNKFTLQKFHEVRSWETASQRVRGGTTEVRF